MKVTKTEFEGLCVLEPAVLEDARGYFMESFNARVLENAGLKADFLQDNQSFSTAGVLRGLHYQSAPYAQTKLVRVLAGTILDVVVDLRREQPTFGKCFTIELSSRNKKQLYVPKGFAHGFSVLGDSAAILYKCDNYYNRDSEGGILYSDPALSIDWRLPEDKIVLSEKDARNPRLAEATFKF